MNGPRENSDSIDCTVLQESATTLLVDLKQSGNLRFFFVLFQTAGGVESVLRRIQIYAIKLEENLVALLGKISRGEAVTRKELVIIQGMLLDYVSLIHSAVDSVDSNSQNSQLRAEFNRIKLQTSELSYALEDMGINESN